MNSIVPTARPQWPQDRVLDLLVNASVADPVALVGVRGYYRDTMGVRGENDLGIYDDAIFVISPWAFASFNANTDPVRYGWNRKIGKPFAALAAGIYRYKLGPHKGYPACVQAGPVTVERRPATHPVGTYRETGWYGINMHKGALKSTSSEGCQTIYLLQWVAFIALVTSELKRAKQRTFPYMLVESQG